MRKSVLLAVSFIICSFTASGQGRIEVLKMLLGNGADVYVKASGIFSGTTALKNAVHSRHTAIINLLKQAGAKE